MNRHRKVFSPVDDEDRRLVDMAFSKKRADERKDWLKTCTSRTFMDTSEEVIHVKDFINKELILFSMADNIRSIPSMVDGLKPGHRKILFSCFKRKLKGEIKVAQLAGYVSEHSAYHHGEQSLCATIIGMAQNFVGSNNVNLLEPNGQFGTRLQGGKDAASARYVFTSLSPFARLLFRTEDDALLKYLADDGQSIEPEWYLPVLPLVLVNGGEGIGTGWMTAIPTFNPRDIVSNLKRLMGGDEAEIMHPWYQGFLGAVEAQGPDRYRISGCWEKIDGNALEVTELPIGTWTQSYKEMLEGMISPDKGEPLIRDYKEYHTDTTVRFVINLTDEQMRTAESEGIEKRFKLTSLINLNNLVCFDAQGRLRKYATPLAILEEFYHLRLEYYVKRKDWMAEHLTQEWTRLDNRVRFVQEIIDGKLIVQNKKKADIVKDLAARGFAPFASGKTAGKEAGEESDAEGTEVAVDTLPTKNYDYLLTMPIYSLTREKIEKLCSERAIKEDELNALLALAPKELWRRDLDEFVQAWDEHEAGAQKISATERAKSRGTALKATTKGKPTTARGNKKAKNTASTTASEVEDDEVQYSQSSVTNKPVAARTAQTKRSKKTVEAVVAPIRSMDTLTSNTPMAAPLASAAIVLDADTLSSMSLSDRINYMLQQKSRQSTLDGHFQPKPAASIASIVPPPPFTSNTLVPKKPDLQTRNANRPRKRIVLSSDEEEDRADDDVYHEE